MPQRAAKTVVKLRFVLVPLWVAGAVLTLVYLPSFGQEAGGAINAQLLPEDAPPVQAEKLSKLNFSLPLVTRTLVVAYDEKGLPPQALREAAQTAQAVQEGQLSGLDGLAAVVPVPNVLFEPEGRLTTILYYTYFPPEINLFEAGTSPKTLPTSTLSHGMQRHSSGSRAANRRPSFAEASSSTISLP